MYIHAIYMLVMLSTGMYPVSTGMYPVYTRLHVMLERAGVTKLYEPSPTPCLYVAPAFCMVGRVPLIPLFLSGNLTLTIPHKFRKHKSSGFPTGICDTAAVDGQLGSNVYEANP
jgi:hypothetical protein